MPTTWKMLRWTTLHIPTCRPLPVFLASDEHEPALAKDHPTGGETGGLLCFGSWRLLVWAGLPRKDYARIIIHEIVHSILSDVPRRTLNNGTEESVAMALDASVPSVLARWGWTLPELPDGWRSLAAHARHQRYGRKQREE
ncbi:MAG: hypothetical protein WDA27_14645 [Actinomycetota bacterium]